METIGSLIGGGVGSTTIFVITMFTPIGWGLAITLAAGSAATAYLAGIGAKTVYNKYGNSYDLTQHTSVNKLCR